MVVSEGNFSVPEMGSQESASTDSVEYGQNQPQYELDPERRAPKEMYTPPATNSATQQPGPNPIIGAQGSTLYQVPLDPAQALQQGATTNQGDEGNEIEPDDLVWIDRAKNAVMQTQNDPHRQLQHIQQLRNLFVKERFGYDVQKNKDKK